MLDELVELELELVELLVEVVVEVELLVLVVLVEVDEEVVDVANCVKSLFQVAEVPDVDC